MTYEDMESCVIVAEENAIRLTRKQRVGEAQESLIFIFAEATRIRQIILDESHQTVGTDAEEQYDPEEFQWLCGQLYEFVRTHHLKGKKHVSIASVSDMLATQEAKAALLDEKLSSRLGIATIPLLITLIGFPLGFAIGDAIISHKVREKVRSFIKQRYIHATKHGRLYFRLNNRPDALVYYYNGNHFGVVEIAEPKNGGGLFFVGGADEKSH